MSGRKPDRSEYDHFSQKCQTAFITKYGKVSAYLDVRWIDDVCCFRVSDKKAGISVDYKILKKRIRRVV